MKGDDREEMRKISMLVKERDSDCSGLSSLLYVDVDAK